MSAHYGVSVIPTEHKNAINVAVALWQGENPALSENLSQPANATGSPDDPVTHWFGGRPYSDAELAVIQAFADNLPSANWPVQGVSGPVSLVEAQAAAAAMVINVTTQDEYTTQQAQVTFAAVMTALGLKRVEFPL